MLDVKLATGDTCLNKLLPHRECYALFEQDICNVRDLIDFYKGNEFAFRSSVLRMRNLGERSVQYLKTLIAELKECNPAIFDDDKCYIRLWEQRKFELVKAYSVELIKLQMEKGFIDCGYSEQKISEYSISLANKVIKDYKSNHQ